MSGFWLDILRQAVEEKGSTQVARELGVSPTTVSLVMSGKYGASTQNIEQKVMNIYGNEGMVTCPQLGMIEPSRCLANWERAKRVGVGTGDPVTMRLHIHCRKCSIRSR